MRAPGMPMGFIQILSAGPQPPPPVASGAIGPSFFTPEQAAFRSMRKVYGGDDVDSASYSLASIDWNKEDGTATVGHFDSGAAGWLGA